VSQNRKKAFWWAMGALLVCSIPLAARVWLQLNGAIERPELGAVGDFIIRDESGAPLNRDQLRRSVTVVIHWPNSCVGNLNCESARSMVNQVQGWVGKSLKPKWTEENNPLNLVIVGDGASSLSRADGWRVFPEPAEPGTIIPSSARTSEPWVIIIDNNLLFAAQENLNGEVNFKALERTLSKTAFDQYLGNYLSSRTFMGPKRRQN
jgi:hypothetical protein